MNKLISVIIPVYNVEKFLPACIDSAINQTYKNIEIILIDDGSPDKCPQICDEYAIKDSRIKVIHKENGGISSARNAGIEAANGEFIYFIDGDDFTDSQSLEILLQPIIEDSEVDISIGGFKRVFYTDNKENIDAPNLYDNTSINYVEVKDYKMLFHIDLWMVVWGKLIKKQLFNDLCFPEGKIHEDEFVAYKLCDKSKKIIFCDKILYNYVKRGDSITQKISSRGVENRIEAFIEAIHYFHSKNNKYCQFYYGRRLSNYMIKIYDISKENTEIDFRKYEKKFFKEAFIHLHFKTKIKYLLKRFV